MADEVLDSWEDMIDDDNGLLVKRFDDIRVTDTNQDMRSTTRPVVIAGSNTPNKSAITGTDGSDWSPIVGNNKAHNNCNPIKILKRPTNSEPMSSGLNEVTKCQNDSNQNQNNICPQITLEDNTRTQYVPQVRILKRPNADAKDKSVANDRSINANKSQTNNKTYEEREAEYAKARLRIMGSASAPEESNQASAVRNTPQTSNSCNASPKRSSEPSCQSTNYIETNVPIIRLPYGPDGTTGFNRELTSEQR